MGKIYTIGETIYDIIFRNNEPVAARAGGAMLNTAVSLGRLGMPVHLISEYGADRVGDIIESFLHENGVDTSFVSRYGEGKTAVSHAFLDENGNAAYSFYKIYPEERLKLDKPVFSEDDIVLFGGFYSLMKEVRQQVVDLVTSANNAGALVIYDPNVRSPHMDEITALREMVYENLRMAQLVRGSDEDFMTVLDIPDGEQANVLVKEHGCRYLVYTRSKFDVSVFYPGGKIKLIVPEVDALSTIGAGDTFNAGLIFELHRQGISAANLAGANMEEMVRTAIRFGSHACTHYDNYITESFAREQIRDAGF